MTLREWGREKVTKRERRNRGGGGGKGEEGDEGKGRVERRS